MSNNYIIKLCESNRTGINNNNYNNKLRSYFFFLKILIIYILFVFVPYQNIHILYQYLTKYYILLLSNHFTFTFTSWNNLYVLGIAQLKM